MSQDEIEAARADVQRSRAQVADTLATLRARITEPVHVVRRKLDVADAVHRNPWSALAIAVGAGTLLAATGADKRAAVAAAEAARQGAQGAARLAQQAAEATGEAARQAPGRTREALIVAAEAVATRLAMSLIGSFRDDSTVAAAAHAEHTASMHDEAEATVDFV